MASKSSESTLKTSRLTSLLHLDGLQLVCEIRASKDTSVAGLPIIMLTSKNQERDVIEGLEVGMDDYVSKPFSPDELAARVRTVLWRARRTRD